VDFYLNNKFETLVPDERVNCVKPWSHLQSHPVILVMCSIAKASLVGIEHLNLPGRFL